MSVAWEEIVSPSFTKKKKKICTYLRILQLQHVNPFAAAAFKKKNRSQNLSYTHTSIKLLIYLKEGHENFSAWKWGHNLVTIMKYVRVISLILAEDETPKHIWQNLSFRC